MTERYAELILYFGLCPMDGRLEGRFDPMTTNQWARRWYNQSLEQVERYLSPGWRWGLHYGGGSDDNLVDNEDDARLLISFAETNIPNAKGETVLLDAMHGRIRFWRKIRFDGATEEEIDTLIQQLKQSGFSPKDKERERAMLFMKQHPAVWPDEEIEKRLKKEGLDEDRKWRAAIKFH